MNLLEIKGLTLKFGGLTAVDRIDLTVAEGEILSVIGPNGAGKTTVFNAVTGIYDPAEGRILSNGRETRAVVTGRTLLGLGCVAILTAVATVFAINMEAMWVAVVEKNFVYQKSFPYGAAMSDAAAFVRNQPARRTLIPLAAAGVIGMAGGFSIWRRTRRAPNVIAGQGIARTFQNIRLFQEMTALENVLAGMDQHLRTRLWHAAFRLPANRREAESASRRAMEILEFVDLKADAGTLARCLSYGHQRRLEIARALATKPKLLLLDEPAAGMNPSETGGLMALIRKIRDSGVTVLLIEHHMRVVMGISDRIAVLDYGRKIAEGSPREIRENPQVIEAYLGKESEGG